MKYPLIALPLSTLLVLTGCGGSGSGGDDASQPPPPPPPASAPTVTVTAPASAVIDVAFNVAWTSTNATSCSSDFTSETGTSGDVSVTKSATGAATYAVTCTGAGGSTTNSAIVSVAPKATPEGLWQGTTASGGVSRNLSGVVTKENNYWLAYNGDVNGGSANATVGFFAGSGSAVINSQGKGGSFDSANLREFNFEGAGAYGGTLTGGLFDKSAATSTAFSLNGTANSRLLSAPHTFTGEQEYIIDAVTTPGGMGAIVSGSPVDPVPFSDGGTAWNIVPNANDLTGTAALSGSLNFGSYTINVTIPDFGPGGPGTDAEVHLAYTNRSLTITPQGSTVVSWDAPTRTLTMTNVLFTETSSVPPACTDNGLVPGMFCDFVPTSTPHGDVEIVYDDADLDTFTGKAYAFQEVDFFSPDPAQKCYLDNPGHVMPDYNDPNLPPGNLCATAILSFEGSVPSAPIVPNTVATTYNANYEAVPALADIAGSYAGSAGVDATINGSATFDIASDGSVSGLEATGCTYAGNVTTHTSGGNVYDVALTFTAGGSCTYSGPFEGVATYDADNGSVTVTAVNSDRDQGFLFTGSKVP